MKFSVFLVFVRYSLVITAQIATGTDCIHDDDSCELYSSSGYRLQFLGGYDDDELNEMCYSHKLHEYKHIQTKYNQPVEDEDDDDIITVLLEICGLESKKRKYGV